MKIKTKIYKIIELSKPRNTFNCNRYPIATKTKPNKTLPKHNYMAFVINNKPNANNQTFKVAQNSSMLDILVIQNMNFKLILCLIIYIPKLCHLKNSNCGFFL
jgi:hypothetical protein